MTRQANIDLPARILDEAEKIVVESGHGSINMRELAGRIGVSATALYHYYSSKEDLILRLKLRAAEKLNARIRRIDAALPPDEVLHRLGREYIDFAEENPRLYRLLFEESAGDPAPGSSEQPILYFTYNVARTAIERMAAAGQYEIDPRYGALMGWTMLHGFCSLLLSGRLQLAEGMDREALKEIFLGFYAGGGKPR